MPPVKVVMSPLLSFRMIVRAPSAVVLVSVIGNWIPGVPSFAVIEDSDPIVMSAGPLIVAVIVLESPGPYIVTVTVPWERDTVSPVVAATPKPRLTPRNSALGVGLD